MPRGRLGLTVCLAAFVAPLLGAQDGVSTFPALFDQYRHGNAEIAVDAFSRWSPARVEKEAVLTGVALEDPASLSALVLLHTEAGIRNRTYGRFRTDAARFLILGDWGLENVFEVHAYSAYRLMERLVDIPEPEPAIESFMRSWYVISVSHCLRHGLECTPGLLAKAEHHFGDDDPDVRLLTGSVAETLAYDGGAFGSSLSRTSTSHGLIGAARQPAEWAFRKLLRDDPNHVEGRLRLGRLLHILDRNTEAQAELEEALHQARLQNHLFGAHLAAFFLGELHEDQERIDEAIRHYRAAVDQLPHAHTASIALGQLLVRHGQAEAGWQLTRRMFGSEGPGVEPVLDPYPIYRGAQTYQGASRVRSMRAAVRAVTR